jgi:hypothetical protein
MSVFSPYLSSTLRINSEIYNPKLYRPLWRSRISSAQNMSHFHSKWPTWRTILFYVFISNFYMFRATSCSSSEEPIVSIQPLVYVTLCRWLFRVQVGNFPFDLHTKFFESIFRTRKILKFLKHDVLSLARKSKTGLNKYKAEYSSNIRSGMQIRFSVCLICWLWEEYARIIQCLIHNL